MEYTSTMTGIKTMPSKKQLAKIAANQPELLNLLVAYFVFEWQAAKVGNPPHGVDQVGVSHHIPDYIGMWTDRHTGRCGIANAMSLLLACPQSREANGPGYLEGWMRACSEEI